MKHRRGFTAIELITVIGVLSFLMVAVVPSYKAMQRTMALQNEVQEVADVIRVARTGSLTADGSENHGVRFTSTSYELFSASSTTALHILPAGMTITASVPSVTFTRLSGEADAAVNLTVGYTGGAQKTIDVRSNGTIVLE